METFGALHLRFVADSRAPFIVAGGRVSTLSGLLVFPTLWINRPARPEQIKKQGDFLRGRARNPRRRGRSSGIDLEMPLGLKGYEFFLGLEKLSRKFDQSSAKFSCVQVLR